MAGKADVCSPGGLYLRTIHDSTQVPIDEWDALQADYRAEPPVIELRCPNCRARLTTRRSVLDTQFFAHWPNESPDCTNRGHEGETDEHRETCDLIAADFEAIGGRAEREWKMPGGTADVAVWSASSGMFHPPATIAEYERKCDTLDEYRDRDRVRQTALAQGPDGAWGRKAVIWVAREAHASTHLRHPQLYLSQDGATINDGAYHQADLSNDNAQPALLDRRESFEMITTGRMVRLEGVVYTGNGNYGNAWIVRPGAVEVKRARRRKSHAKRDPHVASDCARPPVAADRSTQPARLPAKAPQPCRLCGEPAWFADADGGFHACCVRNASTLAAGRPCPSCEAAKARIRQLGQRKQR